MRTAKLASCPWPAYTPVLPLRNALMRQIETIAFAGTLVEILVAGDETDRQFSLLRITNPPGVWTPPHRHLHEEETIYVLSGQVQVETGGETRSLSAGEV